MNRNLSEFFKSLWNDPQFRQRQITAYRQSWTPERKELVRERMTGHKHSEATIQKISESNIRTWHKKRKIKEAGN